MYQFAGKWYNLEFAINVNLKLSIPPRQEIMSHLVLMFEVWKLKRGKYDPVDKVCAVATLDLA